METPIDYGRLVFERQEVVDALHRFTYGLDTGDAAVLGSAFTPDAVVDLTGTARRIGAAHFARPGTAEGLDAGPDGRGGAEFPVLRGRDAIIATLTAVVGPLDTSHTTSNHQVQVKGDSAALTAYVMAQHYLPGRGADPNSTEHALFMSRYECSLTREDGAWCFTRIAVHTLWFDGDPAVAVGGAGTAGA